MALRKKSDGPGRAADREENFLLRRGWRWIARDPSTKPLLRIREAAAPLRMPEMAGYERPSLADTAGGLR
jgi:hypothetical protein